MSYGFVADAPHRSMPGDYGLGWFGLRDKGRHERELICELEHCRLAQVAFLVQLISERYSGLPWEQQWALYWDESSSIVDPAALVQ